MVALFRLQRGLVQYERNELTQASRNLLRANDYLELVNSFLRLSVYASLVDLYLALGDGEKAFDILGKLKRHNLREDYSASYFPVAAWIAQRNLSLSQYEPNLNQLVADPVRWAETAGLESNDSFRFEQEFEYRTLARVLIAQGNVAEAIPLLTRLMQAAENSGRWGDLIVCLSLMALAQHAQDRTESALAHLSRALRLAEPERYVRTFIDLGPCMRDLLFVAAEQGIAASYVPTLLAAFPAQDVQTSSPSNSRQMSSAHSPSPTRVVEPLNDRECQILRLMAAMFSNREIAEELHLSVNTVKWYARQIYEKLGVSGRREAVGRARELGILSP